MCYKMCNNIMFKKLQAMYKIARMKLFSSLTFESFASISWQQNVHGSFTHCKNINEFIFRLQQKPLSQ